MTNKSEEFLRIATINTLNTKDFFFERLETLLVEAKNKQVDVLLLQEILTEFLEEAQELCSKHGYDNIVSTQTDDFPERFNKPNNNMVISRFPYISRDIIEFENIEQAIAAPVMEIKYNNHHVFIISSHFYWGANRGHIRLQQARIISDYGRAITAENSKATVIFGGDLNALPEEAAVQYLQGVFSVEEHHSAFWLDVTTRTEWEKYPTTRPYGEWGIRTAQEVGILDPMLVPERKIDYIFVQGWIYGQIGSPSNVSLFGSTLTTDGHEISDHYGVIADIWLPKV